MGQWHSNWEAFALYTQFRWGKLELNSPRVQLLKEMDANQYRSKYFLNPVCLVLIHYSFYTFIYIGYSYH